MAVPCQAQDASQMQKETPREGGTAPMSSQPPQGWIADPRSGCKVAYPKPQSGMSITWSGQCANGFAEGPGVVEWMSNQRLIERYEGVMHGGMQVQGTTTWSDGRRYEGQWRDERINGRGTFRWPDGRVYVGDWKDGTYDGTGDFTWANGDHYIGAWLQGKRNGYGRMWWKDGARYEGNWRMDRAHGPGTYTAISGNVYAGNWNNGCYYDGQRRARVGASAQECGFQQ
jgi:hypothetical protein